MAKHIDLLAVGVLLLAFLFAARIQEAIHLGGGSVRLIRIHAIDPVVVVPHHLPQASRYWQRLSRFPRA
jgi:hypothetical protein